MTVFKNKIFFENQNSILGISISSFLHLFLFGIFILFSEFPSFNSGRGGGFVEISSYSGGEGNNMEIGSNEIPQTDAKEIQEKIKTDISEEKIVTGEKQSSNNSGENSLGTGNTSSSGSGTGYGGLFANADTTGLKNYYSETTLNVRIRYPQGWSLIDQNVKKKLDGVTFWGIQIGNNPPPYIHLEVKDKYYFRASNFKYKTEMKNCIAYFNDPEEMEGTYNQVVYLRTETNEDYSIKLIMTGKEAFYQYQPIFFGMIRTFKFGSNLLNW